MNAIVEKILSLGGGKKNPLCPDDDSKNSKINLFIDIENQFNSILPVSYKNFYNIFGPFSFSKTIQIKCIDAVPIASNGNKVAVNYFYSIAKTGECSMLNLISTYEEQLPENLLPICDGEPGDLICISLREIEYGEIYYWHHESDAGKNLFLVSQSFEDFIMSLEISESIIDDNLVKDMQVELSAKMLELIRQSAIQSGEGSRKE